MLEALRLSSVRCAIPVTAAEPASARGFATIAVMPDELRSQLVLLLRGNQAHMTFDEAVADFPEWAINERAPNVDYTPWHLVEHLRLTQLDMLRYIEDSAGYESPPWPVAYWPDRTRNHGSRRLPAFGRAVPCRSTRDGEDRAR